MSFGQQGVIRYAVLVDDSQAERAVTAYKNNLTQLGAATTQTQGKMAGFQTQLTKQNNAFMAGVNPIKAQGNALTGLNTQLKATQTQSVSLGSKIKTTATSFAGFATGLSATATGVLQLGAGFRDYNDAQIAVERQTRKLSLAQEAVTKAGDKLEKLQSKGIRSGKEYAQAQLDVSQAQQNLSVQTQLLGEKQEDLFDSQTQFVASVIPVTLGAVGTLGSAFKDLGLNMGKMKSTFSTIGSGASGVVSKLIGLATGAGTAGAGLFGLGTKSEGAAKALTNVNTQGLGATGMLSKLKGGLSSIAGSMGLTTTGLLGMSAALGGVVLGLIELDKQMKLAQWAHEFDAAGGASHRTLEQLRVDLAKSKEEASSWGSELKNVFSAMSFTNIFNQDEIKKNINFWPEVIKSLEQSIGRKEAQEAFAKMMDSVMATDLSPRSKANISGIVAKIQAILKNDFNFAAREGVTAQQSTDYTMAVVAGLEKNLDAALQSAALDTVIEKNMNTFMKSASAHMEGLSGALATGFLAKNKGANIGGAMTQLFAIDPKPIAASLDPIGKLYDNVMHKITANISTFTGETQKAFQKVTGVVQAANVGGEMTKAFALDPKPISAGLDTIGAKYKVIQAALVKTSTENNKLAATFGPLNKATLANVDVRAKLLEISDKQTNGHKAEEVAILEMASANDVYSGTLANLAATEGDHVTQMNNILAMTIDYTSALTNQTKNQKLVSEGFRDGIIQAKTFFDDLVKGTEQQIDFNLSLADGAEELGITSDLLAFSSSKMQDLIKDVHETAVGFDDMSLAAAKNTSFLRDNVLINSQLNKGFLEGVQAANDWAISNIKATASASAFHTQLVQVVADMTGAEIPIGTSNEALQKMAKTFEETGDAGRALAQMMTDNVAPAFERLSSVIQSKDMKELRDNLKKLELPKGFSHDLDDAFKPLRGAAETARKVGNAMDVLVTAGDNMSKKDLAKNMKAFGNELDRMSKIKGTSKPVDAILMSLKTMTPAQLDQHSQSMQFLVDTINKFGSLPTDKAQDFIDMFNKETVKMGPNANTASTGVDKLTGSIAAFNTAAGNMQGLDKHTTDVFTQGLNAWMGAKPAEQKTTITVDNTDALTKVAAVSTAINGLTKIKAQISLLNNNAITAVQTTAGEIDGLTKIKAEISLQNRNAFNAIDAVDKQIKSLDKIKPQISLQNRNAFSAIDAVEKQIKALDKIKPQISLQNRNAFNAIDAVEKQIKALDKIKPQISLQNRNAFNAIDAVKKEIMKLENLKPNIKVSFSGTGTLKATGSASLSGGGKISIAQRGMHEFLKKDTTIVAHAGERVDIGQPETAKDDGKRPEASMKSRDNTPKDNVMMGNIAVNNYIDLGSDTIVRSFKRRLGSNVYSYGK